jgi:hypothetical protein
MGKGFVGILGAVFFLFILFLVSGEAMAQHGHDRGVAPPSSSKKSTSPEGLKAKGFAQSLTIEGWKVTIEVMGMGEHTKHAPKSSSHSETEHSKSHSIMVTIQDTASQEIISDAKVIFSVSSPSGAKESGKLEWSGDFYGGGFSPKGKGIYQVQLKIASGGMEREAKFLYEAMQ